MTRHLSGYLVGRPFCAVRDPETGELDRLIDLATGHEVPDRETFEGTNWLEVEANLKKPARPKKQRKPRTEGD